MALYTRTPSAAAALYDQWTGVPIGDPKNYDEGRDADQRRIDGRYVLVPPQSEIMKLIQMQTYGGNALPVSYAAGSWSTLSAGSLVTIDGYDQTAGRLTIRPSDCADLTTAAAYVTAAEIAEDGLALVYPYYLVTGLDTSAGDVGDQIYLGTDGQWTLTPPEAPNILQRVGVLTIKDATTGAIHFFPGARILER